MPSKGSRSAAWADYAHAVHGAKAAVLGADGKSNGIPIATDSRGIWYSIPVLRLTAPIQT
ncbi:MAG: hypothetical protein RSH26_04055 [Clostridia bacterium]